MASGKKEEFGFRDLADALVLIVNDGNIPVVGKVFEHKENDNAILAYGYIDHTAGLTFEVLCMGNYSSHGEIELNQGNRETSFKLRYDSVNGMIVLLDNVELLTYQDKIDMIKSGYRVNDAVLKARNTLIFDDFRHIQFPDDVMLLFYKEGVRPEGIWCRVESEEGGKPVAKLLNEPYADFGVHIGDLVAFEWGKQEDKMIGVAVLPWMK